MTRIFRILCAALAIGLFPALSYAEVTSEQRQEFEQVIRDYLLENPELIEAAHLDGASDGQVFTRIILPLSLPAIASLAIFQFLWVWNDLLVALVLLGDPSLSPMTVHITSLVSSFGSSYQVLTAAAFISMALPLAVFFAFQRFFVQGVLAGAVKG